MFKENTLKELSAEQKELRAWVETNRESLCGALGLYTSDVDTLTLLLWKLRDTRWTGFKDDVDRARDNVLWAFMRGDKTDEQELRTAVQLLKQQFNAACDEIASLRARVKRPSPSPFKRPPYVR